MHNGVYLVKQFCVQIDMCLAKVDKNLRVLVGKEGHHSTCVHLTSVLSLNNDTWFRLKLQPSSQGPNCTLFVQRYLLDLLFDVQVLPLPS